MEAPTPTSVIPHPVAVAHYYSAVYNLLSASCRITIM